MDWSKSEDMQYHTEWTVDWMDTLEINIINAKKLFRGEMSNNKAMMPLGRGKQFLLDKQTEKVKFVKV